MEEYMKILNEPSTDKTSQKFTHQEIEPNRLAHEKSPYLLQHATNPVDWYPWGEEAFEKARREDKPIFLSVGYSTCYWCHVMEREVFENKAIAKIMNRWVVSIKVDREERPDLDRVYMAALQTMTGSGGWPMSIFMTPEYKPFYAATYIPPTNQDGRIGFLELLTRIHDVWEHERSKIVGHGNRITEILQESEKAQHPVTPISLSILDHAFDEFVQSFDSTFGGFGTAPKFPRPTIYNFLLRYYSRTGNLIARDMALATLQKIAEGGIYDQLGGGFHRYSTDERWHVPHFEKMLYDQAQLVISFLEAFQITHDPFYAQIAREVLGYVQRVLSHPEGGFYSAEDAESAVSRTDPMKKKEGAFYIWKKKEIDSLLNDQLAKIAAFGYGIQETGNVPREGGRELSGENILFIANSVENIVHLMGEKIEDVQAYLDTVKGKLFSARELRPKPHKDDKLLLSWNSLMISAFAKAYQIFHDPSYLATARDAVQFLLSKLYNPISEKLLRRFRNDEAKIESQLADYAYFVQGMLDLYEASFEIAWLKMAITLTEEQIKLFYDEDRGGFFDTDGTDPTLLLRTKETYDGAEPSGNSIAILNLLRLSQMIGSNRYQDMASRSLMCFGEIMEKNPHAVPQLLVALDYSLSKPMQIVLAGDMEHPLVLDMLNELHSRFQPHKVVLFADGSQGQEFLSQYVHFYEDLLADEKDPKIYICQNYTCELPISDVQKLQQTLDRSNRLIDPGE